MNRRGAWPAWRRLGVAVVAAWTVVFAIVGVAHHHGPLRPQQQGSTLDQPSLKSPGPATCLACLASHVPIVSDGGLALPAPSLGAETSSSEYRPPVRTIRATARSSRAPPSLLLTAV